MKNLYSNYLQLYTVYDALENYYCYCDNVDNKANYHLNDFYEYLKKKSNLDQNKKSNVISICQHIINNQNNYYYFDKFNSPWMQPQMNFIKWIKHCSHPCPIITISKNNNNRINNFDVTHFDASILKNQLIPSNLKCVIPNVAYMAKSNAGFIKFQHYFDQYILSSSDKFKEISFISRKINDINLDKIVNSLNINSISNQQQKYYCLQYSKIICNKFDLNLLIQVSPITSRSLLKGTKIKGSKFKIQIIQSQLIWDSEITIKQQIIYYKISRYLTNIIMKSGNCIWNQHYYYQYCINFATDLVNSSISYAYIDYSATKPIESIKKYYSKSSKINRQNHNKLFKYFSHKTGISYNIHNCNPSISHLFWIGATVHRKVISKQWKNLLFSKIHSWKTNGVPKGVHCDKGSKDEKLDKRWKFFIMYRYAYRLNKNISSAQINKANLKAGGLRNIKNCCKIPNWLNELIQYLKGIRFINPNVEINQIGINYYFNNKLTPIYNSIDPHLEDDKFSVVYSISIYKNPDSPTCLSFGLNLNYSCGDTKIVMNDCDGIKLESCVNVFFLK